MFDAPATAGETLKPSEINGHLLIVKAVDYRTGINTTFGEKDAVSVNVVDLDENDPDTGQPGRLHKGALWFSGMLVGSLKNQIGAVVLARMGQGTAKPNQDPPWILVAANEDAAAVQRGTTWMNANPGALDGFAPPATTNPAPTPAPAPAPAPPAVTPITPDNPALAGLTPEALALLQQFQAQQAKAG